MFASLIKESIRFALGSLWGNKLRTFLSLFGIVIGIFSIILVLSAVNSLEKNIEGTFNSLGTNVVFVGKWPWDGMGPDYPYWKYMKRPQPSPAEVELIRRRASSVADVAFRSQFGTNGAYKDMSAENIQLMGISYEFDRLRPLDIEQGRYFTEQESRYGKNVAILGVETAQALFPDGGGVGKTIKLNGKNFEVIGTLAREGQGLLGGFNDQAVFIPLQSYRSMVNLNSSNVFSEILVQPKPGISNEGIMDELRGTMRSIRKLRPTEDDDFALNETSILTQMTEATFAVLNIVGWIIGMFAIFIGGFGVANIMFVSVKERTNIIGIQKALGARRSFILWQFLVESVVLSLLGGLAGLGLVAAAAWIVTTNFDFEINMSAQNALIGIILSVVTGMVAGIIPAWMASRLDPVEAIRSK